MVDQTTNLVIVGFVSALLGAVLGGGSAIVILGRVFNNIKSDPVQLAYGEHLYNSIPVTAIREVIRSGIEIGNEITDGIPIESKNLNLTAKPSGQS